MRIYHQIDSSPVSDVRFRFTEYINISLDLDMQSVSATERFKLESLLMHIVTDETLAKW